MTDINAEFQSDRDSAWKRSLIRDSQGGEAAEDQGGASTPWPWMVRYGLPRTALLPWTEMAIYKAVMLRPLFQEVTLASPVAQELLQWGYGYPRCRLLFALLPTGTRKGDGGK